jgi:hypothetical protein
MIYMIFLILLPGCAFLEQLRDNTNNVASRQKKQAEKIERERGAEKARSEAMVVGKDLAEFKAVWGEPDFTEVENGVTFLNYTKDFDPPLIFSFQDQKLTGWKKDREAIASQRDEKRHREQLKAQEEQIRIQRANAIMNTMPKTKTTNCLPTYGGGVQCTSY